MLSNPLLLLGKVVLSILGPGLIYFGLQQWSEWRSHANTAKGYAKEYPYGVGADPDPGGNPARLQRFYGGIAFVLGLILIVLGIALCLLWWHLVLGPSFGGLFLSRGIVERQCSTP